jgi:nitrogen regulatory protein P-II 2
MRNRVVVIVKPFRLDAVLEALKPLPVSTVSWQEVRGYGRQKGHLELYQGSEYSITFLPKIRLELSCPVGDTEAVIGAVRDAARTGRIGDGKVFVLEEAGDPAP